MISERCGRTRPLSLTPWLLANGDVFADVLGIDLELTAAEHGIGSFSLDLVGRDLTNDCVLIVENQLTPTDHDHLGKLISYAAGTDAQTVVWLAPSFREEHREALDLLKNLGGEQVRFTASSSAQSASPTHHQRRFSSFGLSRTTGTLSSRALLAVCPREAESRRSTWSSGRDSFSA